MKKIQNKIIISVAAIIILFAIALLIFVDNQLRKDHLVIIKSEMDMETELIELLLTGKALKADNLSQQLANISKKINYRITIIGLDGIALADSEKPVSDMDNHLYRKEVKDSIASGKGESIRFSHTLNIDMLYFARNNGKYIIRISKPLYQIDDALNNLRIIIFLTAFGIMIFALFFIMIFSKKITDPIKETMNFAEDFANGDYTKKILNYKNDEVGALQRSLNKLADVIVNKMSALAIEQNKLMVTIDNISDGIAVIDSNKKIVIANKAFASMLKLTEYINKKYYEIIRSSNLDSIIEFCLLNGERVNFTNKFNNDIICDIFIIPLKEIKSIQGILLVLHNITEKKKLDEMKTELVANLSHELKTPVTIIKGYLETIKENFKEPVIDKNLLTDYINRAIQNAERQNSILNDMLKLNMLESIADFSSEKINLKDIIANCVNILSAKAEKKKLDIDFITDFPYKDIPANKFLVEEIFFNIIDNAINYTNSGGNVIITAEQADSKLKITVADTGIGIPADSLDRIFERFYRVDKSRSRETGGTGLGLSIVKHAIELLNWNINVESDKDGTKFIIEISI